MLKENYDVDLEEGELSVSSDDGYTPLQRPSLTDAGRDGHNFIKNTDNVIKSSPLATCHQQLQRALQEEEDDDDDEEDNQSSDSDSSSCMSLAGVKKKANRRCNVVEKRKKRTMMIRVPTTDINQRARFKRYNVWTEAMQEDTLTETLRSFDVKNPVNDRNVENYDYSLKFRLNGENSLKRRFSTSTDDLSDGLEQQPHKQKQLSAKRGRFTSTHEHVKRRLGHRSSSSSGKRVSSRSSPTSSSDHSDQQHLITDLSHTILDLNKVEVAREIADKLYEEKDDLMVRIVETLGKEIPVEIFKETQRIEADGGMMIKNGKRRRTPGGVFLFLLKNDERLTDSNKKIIFNDERQQEIKRRKEEKTLARDRKVEELKKRLNEQKPELPALHTRGELQLLGHDLNMKDNKQTVANLSNPPPSPVGNELCPDYKAHDINPAVPDVSVEKSRISHLMLPSAVMPTTSKILVSYDDDFLDVNCTEMDFS